MPAVSRKSRLFLFMSAPSGIALLRWLKRMMGYCEGRRKQHPNVIGRAQVRLTRFIGTCM